MRLMCVSKEQKLTRSREHYKYYEQVTVGSGLSNVVFQASGVHWECKADAIYASGRLASVPTSEHLLEHQVYTLSILHSTYQ